jgi:RNA polymerase sigma factor (sigma-70 family)
MSAKPSILHTAEVEKKSSAPLDHVEWSNEQLVKECVAGCDEAWSALIEKYKRLIYSIPVKYGFTRDDATDIFQAVCLEMLSQLPNLHSPQALPKWIIQITSHKCYHFRRQQQRVEVMDAASPEFEQSVPPQIEHLLREAEEEQNLRQVIAEMPPRCQRLIHMLFYEEPIRPYQEIAQTLGLATGSIGFIRQRCLEKLRKRLQETGF